MIFLQKIGVQHKHMTMVWALSPIIGFFVTPILGSLSDRCHLRMGRRRPCKFIKLFSNFLIFETSIKLSFSYQSEFSLDFYWFQMVKISDILLETTMRS